MAVVNVVELTSLVVEVNVAKVTDLVVVVNVVKGRVRWFWSMR